MAGHSRYTLGFGLVFLGIEVSKTIKPEKQMTPPGSVDLRVAHQHCFRNRHELERSQVAACCYCFRTFAPSEICYFADDYHEGGWMKEATAHCPFCMVDAVLAEASGIPLTGDGLAAIHEYWFSPAGSPKNPVHFLSTSSGETQ